MADPSGTSPRGSASARITPARARRQRRRRIRRVAVVLLTTIVVVGLGLGITWASTRPTGTTYRTAVATMGSVSQNVAAAGSLADVDRADAAFASPGTVATIDVAVGDTVKAGQALGTLDRTDLNSALDDAKTNLSDARQTLRDDKSAQASAAASSSSAASSTTASSTVTGTSSRAAIGSGSGSGYASGSGGETGSTGRQGGSSNGGGFDSGATGSGETAPASRGSGSQTPAAVLSTSASSGERESGGTGSGGTVDQSQIDQAQDAIVGCRQLLDYLIGQGMAAGTCSPAPTTTSNGSGTDRPSRTDTSTGAGRLSDAPGGNASESGERSAAPSGDDSSRHGGSANQAGHGAEITTAVPVSRGCAVILSASGDGGTTVTVTSGTTVTMTTVVTPSTDATTGMPTVSDATVTTTATETQSTTSTIYVTVTNTAGDTATTTSSTDTTTATSAHTSTTSTSTTTGDGDGSDGEPLRNTADAALGAPADSSTSPTSSTSAAPSAGASTSPSAGVTSSGSSPSTPSAFGDGVSAPPAAGSAPAGGMAPTGGPAPGSGSGSGGDSGALAGAVTQCQSAITSAVDALNNLYAWEIVLDDLLQTPGTSSSGTHTGTGWQGTATGGYTGANRSSQAGSRPTDNGGVPGNGTGPSSTTGVRTSVGSHSGTGEIGSDGTGSTNGESTDTGLANTGLANTGSANNRSSNGTAAAHGGSDLSGGAGVGANATSDRVPTAADIAADQAQIDLMQTKVAIAKQDLRGATLTSPIDGTVAQVDIAKGDRVGAASTSKVITVVGRDQYQVEVSIPLSEIDLIKTGQQASVSVDGISEKLTGTVARIGVLNNSSTTTPSYPVTVLVDRGDQTLFDGAGASLTIAIGSVDNVLTVPSSAVHTMGSRHTVTVLKDGATSEVSVEVGLVGPERTQITSGLAAGQVVVLANVDEPIPTTSANARFGGGGFGGAGLGGGQVARFGR